MMIEKTPIEVYDSEMPPVDVDGFPVFMSETDFTPEENDVDAMDPTECPHARTIEVGHGVTTGRFSWGNEYVTEECLDCRKVVASYYTGGLM